MSRFVWLSSVFLSGCIGMSGQEALILDSEDVTQAVTLREARDAKICVKLTGSVGGGGLLTPAAVMGSVDGVVVTGKNVSFADCVAYVRGVALPATPSTTP